MNNTENLCFLEGIISIKAAITAKKRKIDIVYIDKDKVQKRDRKVVSFVAFLKANNIPFTYEKREEIDFLAGQNNAGNTHGGVIAFVGQREYTDIEAFLKQLSLNGKYAVFLDGIEDPFNFGYCIRNFHAFGANGFIVPERNWLSAANIVARASAGASEYAEICTSSCDVKTLQLLRDNGIDIVCAAVSSNSVSLFNYKPEKPFVLFIGGEKRGISKEFFENADTVVHIPYANPDVSYSLPAVSASAIFGSFLSNCF